MLVLTRQKGESIIIGDAENPIGFITVALIKGDRVRIGLDFPTSIAIHRKEVQDEISAGNIRDIPKTTNNQ